MVWDGLGRLRLLDVRLFYVGLSSRRLVYVSKPSSIKLALNIFPVQIRLLISHASVSCRQKLAFDRMSHHVVAVKEKRTVVIQGNSAAWIALIALEGTHRNAYWTLTGLVFLGGWFISHLDLSVQERIELLQPIFFAKD